MQESKALTRQEREKIAAMRLARLQGGKVGKDSTDSAPSVMTVKQILGEGIPLGGKIASHESQPQTMSSSSRVAGGQENCSVVGPSAEQCNKDSEDSTDATPFRTTYAAVPGVDIDVRRSTEADSMVVSEESHPQSQEDTSSSSRVAAGQENTGTVDPSAQPHEEPMEVSTSAVERKETHWQEERRQNLESKKESILLELSERIGLPFNTTKVALMLGFSYNEIRRYELIRNDPVMHLFELLHRHMLAYPTEEGFEKLVAALRKAGMLGDANWLQHKIGLKEKEASITGDDECGSGTSNPSPAATGQGQGSTSPQRKEYYDIFLMYTGKSKETMRFQEICQRHKWKVKSYDESISLGLPVHQAIAKVLESSSHLVVIITENDCIHYKRHEMCMSVEMAFQVAYSQGSLHGKVIPLRCCEKRSLPLMLQALTGCDVNDESLEERLLNTIDTSIRAERERNSQGSC